MRLHSVPSMSNRWNHLVRHGLLGGSLLAAASAPAIAEPCENGNGDNAILGFTLGVDISPKASLIGGVEVRKCVSDKSELMLRVEFGGGGIRAIGGARARPFEDGSYYDDGNTEKLGIEAGLAISLEGDFGAHLAGSYGYNYAYLALQALFPVSTRADRPPVTRTSINAGFSPWSAFESQVVDGRPVSVDGRFLTPDVIALAAARTAEDRAVRDHFARSAQFEYSSVWTFLRLAAELEAVGAPTHLIAAALDAADDEVRHAEMCAREAGGLSLAPLSMLAAQPRFTQRSPHALAILAQEAWAEGCLNEGAAAEEACIASHEAAGSVRETLATIARDEATHAALAWGVLEWVHSIAPAIVRDATLETPSILAATAHDLALVRRGVPSEQITAAARASSVRVATARLRDLLA